MGQRWSAGQQKAHEHRERFAGNVDVALDTLAMPGHPVEPPRQGCFKPVGVLRLQVRGQRCFNDQCLRRAFGRGAIGKLDGQIGCRRTVGLLRTAYFFSNEAAT